ncbi:hypothetical protein ACTFIV_001544 [Dictyostelium citrinum]
MDITKCPFHNSFLSSSQIPTQQQQKQQNNLNRQIFYQKQQEQQNQQQQQQQQNELLLSSVILKFCKMHVRGQDFIIFHIDNLRVEYNNSSFRPSIQVLQNIAQRLCDREQGVGADNTLVLTPPPNDKLGETDFQLLIFNSDGSIAENCTTGVSCVCKYIVDYNLKSYRTNSQNNNQNIQIEQNNNNSGNNNNNVNNDIINNNNNKNNDNSNNQEPHHNEDLKPFFSRNRLKTLNQTPYLLFESRSISIYTMAGIQQCITIPQHPLNNAKTLWSKVSLGNPLVLKTSDHHGGSSGGNFQHPNINQFQIDSNIFQQCPIFKLNNGNNNNNNNNGVNNNLSSSVGRVLLSTNSSYNEYSKVIQCGGHFINSTLVSMGNPHCVLHLENVDEFPMDYYGKVIESHPIFPQKTNVEFVQVKTRDSLRVRVWQRGIGVTNSCGTGAAAALVSGVLRGKNNRKANVQMDGGILEVEWREEDDKVFVSCPSVTVFEGSIKFFQDELQQPF